MSSRTLFVRLAFPALGLAGAAWLLATASRPTAAQTDPVARLLMPLVLRNQPKNVILRPPTAGPVASRTPQIEPTPTPTDTRLPTRTERPTDTETPTTTPSPTPDEPDWLRYVNYHRALANLPPVTENPTWSHGDALHAKYMVKNDEIGHSETAGKPYYSTEGLEAARNGNVAGASPPPLTITWAIDTWMTGPFHMLGIINPQLLSTGFGDYSEGQPLVAGAAGAPAQRFDVQYGATLDTLRGTGELPAVVRFPVRYPESGRSIPNLAYEGGENPDPLAYCPGYTVPTGPPIALSLGGNAAPKVTKTSLRSGDQELPHCWFDEGKYKTPAVAQLTLARHHTIIVIPKAQLSRGSGYTISITTGGTEHKWTFEAGR
jgi:uncharacterized protein YkwD